MCSKFWIQLADKLVFIVQLGLGLELRALFRALGFRGSGFQVKGLEFE